MYPGLLGNEEIIWLMLVEMDIRVPASRERVQIEAAIPAEAAEHADLASADLVTIAQTSGCMFFCDKPPAVSFRIEGARIAEPTMVGDAD